MIRHTLSLVLLVATAAVLSAVTPESLELKKTGEVILVTDTLGEMTMAMGGVKISAEGVHSGVGLSKKTDPSEGMDVTGELVYQLPEDTELHLTEKAAITPSKVVFKADWPNDCQGKGLVKFYLKILDEVGEDLTIEADGKPVFVNFDKGCFLNSVQELVFRKTSTGAFLFRLSGEVRILGGILFDKASPKKGLTIDLHSSPEAAAAGNFTFNEGTNCEWIFSFKE